MPILSSPWSSVDRLADVPLAPRVAAGAAGGGPCFIFGDALGSFSAWVRFRHGECPGSLVRFQPTFVFSTAVWGSLSTQVRFQPRFVFNPGSFSDPGSFSAQVRFQPRFVFSPGSFSAWVRFQHGFVFSLGSFSARVRFRHGFVFGTDSFSARIRFRHGSGDVAPDDEAQDAVVGRVVHGGHAVFGRAAVLPVDGDDVARFGQGRVLQRVAAR